MLAKYGQKGAGGLIHGPAYESADVADHVYRDGFNTQLAIATLKDHLRRKSDKPLFLALGFVKPHLDFIAPKKYWDMYDPADIKLAKQTAAPKNGAAMGLHASFELRTRHGIPKSGPIGEKLARTLLHGYYALRQLRRCSGRHDGRRPGRSWRSRQHDHHRLGETMAGTWVTWACGAKQPIMRSPLECR